MCIVKWFVEKIKKLVEDYEAERWWNGLTDKERSRWCSGLTDEELREQEQYHKECEEVYRQHCKEQAELEARQYREYELEKRLREEDAYYEMQPRCRDCGELKKFCTCGDEE